MLLRRISDRTRGFTLIELLVVIAIVAILAAILFPVFISARQKAKYLQCSNNTHELTRALIMYANDYSNVGVPLVGWGGDCWGSDMTASPLWKYLKSGVAAGGITRCPLDKPTADGKLRNWSITINGFLFGTWYWFAQTGNLGTPEGMPYGTFSKPSRLPAWVCENTDEKLGVPVNDTDFCNADITSNRHQGYCAVTFLDGHSGRLKGLLMWNTAKWPDGEYIFRPTNAR